MERMMYFVSLLAFSSSSFLSSGPRPESTCLPGGGSVHDFVLQNLNGSDIPLSKLRGKAVLLVNVASFCDFTYQYHQLNVLREELEGNVEIVGVPCNQFNLSEPAENDEILNCISYVRPGGGFEPNFIMTVKTDVNGENENPLYTFLKSRCPPPKDEIGNRDKLYFTPIKNGDITWNWNKFLISPYGQPVKRYESCIQPMEIEDDILQLLGETEWEDTEELNALQQELKIEHELEETLEKTVLQKLKQMINFL